METTSFRDGGISWIDGFIIVGGALIAIFESPESWVFVVAIAAVIFGTSKLPEIARSIGRSKGEFQKGLREGTREQSNDQGPADPQSDL